ncbi:hypothetical protein BD289DRAFT_449017 [Coniella lustricola]|uniref:DUF221-domain-containing protein n=1 Tax=Coniella lustricola TaxID=2025994 RepID=A0A2T3ANA0_9PEZI|nr:hypothetical protein BD289DRAFT_449017 [Coniella lustricola]
MASTAPSTVPLHIRDDEAAQTLLGLLQDPFKSEVQSASILASLASSLGVTAAVIILFSFFRPYHTVVYAPKLKHADESKAPPPLGKGPFAWISPLWKTKEKELVRLAGLDAAIFMRFNEMCRNMFLVMAVAACAILIPVNYLLSIESEGVNWAIRLTPQNAWNNAQWGTVLCAWLYNIAVLGSLWWNYRKVLHLRRDYFESPEYQASLHARTLMLYDIPKKLSSDEGIARMIDLIAPNSSFSRTAIARDVKELPDIVAEHNRVVRKLEKVLARYLKDPHNLPAARPMCPPSKKDRAFATYPKGQKLDAIEYLTQRIKTLEFDIKEARVHVDKRNTKPFGFASYSEINEAHAIAYMARKKKPEGATIRLAPRPSDIIWANMSLTPSTRLRKRLIINLWIALLTLVWIAPNAMIAIFLVSFNNLGLLWPAFQTSLSAQPILWAIIQGIASPAISSAIYILLPIIFRRLSIRSGDKTKSGRERHVIAKLYSFFIFNNLVVFSLFSGLWTFVTAVVAATNKGTDAWQAIVAENFGSSIMVALCSVSPYWITYLLQRQLSTAVDLAQVWQLLVALFQRKLGSPTPREMIELSAPQPFDYASHYNYALFYSTVALCYGTIQPLVLPAVALFFIIDCILKKYLLMYTFITKNESGGMSWRVLVNRLLFALFLSNLVVFLVVFERGWGTYIQVWTIVPLPLFVIGAKIYFAKTFDDNIHYYSTRFVPHGPEVEVGIAHKENLRGDRLAAKFGHPVLYRPLITPMVHAKAQNILASVYRGRLSDGREAGSGDGTSVSGYSDTYALDPMNSGKPGKVVGSGLSGFEIVPEGRLDFEYFKNRQEFAEELGSAIDMYRPGTPSSNWGGSDTESRPATPVGGMLHNTHKGGYAPSVVNGGDATYNSPYAAPNRPASPRMTAAYGPPSTEYPSRTRSPYGLVAASESMSNLVRSAAPMSRPHDDSVGGYDSQVADGRTPGQFGGLGGGVGGYGNLPQNEPDYDVDPMSYNYFRGGAARRKSGGM